MFTWPSFDHFVVRRRKNKKIKKILPVLDNLKLAHESLTSNNTSFNGTIKFLLTVIDEVSEFEESEMGSRLDVSFMSNFRNATLLNNFFYKYVKNFDLDQYRHEIVQLNKYSPPETVHLDDWYDGVDIINETLVQGLRNTLFIYVHQFLGAKEEPEDVPLAVDNLSQSELLLVQEKVDHILEDNKGFESFVSHYDFRVLTTMLLETLIACTIIQLRGLSEK